MDYEILIYVGNFGHAPNYVMKSKSPFMAVATGQMIDIIGQPAAKIQQIHHVFLPPPRPGEYPVHQIKIII